MNEVISNLAINGLYDLVKFGFHKIYENVKLVLGRHNVDDETVKLIHDSIKNMDKDAFLNKDALEDYLKNKMVKKTKVQVIKSPSAIVITDSENITLNITNQAKNKKAKHVFEGTIGASHSQKAYIKYLIDRYCEYKKSQEKDRMNYTIIYANIKRQFKINWDEIPSEKFQELAVFLQKRIDATIIGKQQKSKGYSSFETYDEFCRKHL